MKNQTAIQKFIAEVKLQEPEMNKFKTVTDIDFALLVKDAKIKDQEIPQLKAELEKKGWDIMQNSLKSKHMENVDSFFVAEVKPLYKKTKLPVAKITDAQTGVEFLRRIYDRSTLDYNETFKVLYLDRANNVVAFNTHSTGCAHSTVVDVKQLINMCLRVNAQNIILSHNHPSGQTQPSSQDRSITSKLKEACALFDIKVYDHIILTSDSYYSFNEEGSL